VKLLSRSDSLPNPSKAPFEISELLRRLSAFRYWTAQLDTLACKRKRTPASVVNYQDLHALVVRETSQEFGCDQEIPIS
jgi:hypothetical protein